MEAHSAVQVAAGITVILGQFVILIFFFAKIYSQTTNNTERVKELKEVVDDHIKNVKIHQDQKLQSIQFEHLEQKITKLEQRVESLNESIDEIKRILIEQNV